MKICKHNEGGHCLLSDFDWCVEGPCPHEEIVEFVPVVRCKDCKFYYGDHYEGFYCELGMCDDTPDQLFYCKYGERRKEK